MSVSLFLYIKFNPTWFCTPGRSVIVIMYSRGGAEGIASPLLIPCEKLGNYMVLENGEWPWSFLYIYIFCIFYTWLPILLSGKESTCQCRGLREVSSIPGLGRPLEKGMATHSCILAQEIPWTEEPGEL